MKFCGFLVVSFDFSVLDMATYPTPPSSSGDSPQPIFFVASPNSSNFSLVPSDGSQHYIQAQMLSTMDMDDTPTSNAVDGNRFFCFTG